MTGSSMATPLVAGLAALLFEAEPNATAEQIQAAILKSAVRAAHVPAQRAGAGIPDAIKALQKL